MKKATFVIVLVLGLVASSASLYAAPPMQQGQNVCLIASPGSNSQVRGQVGIQGSATHTNFTWYQVGYAPDPNPDGRWTFFSSSEKAVSNGQLAVWDTTALPDGTYQLILEVYRNDGNLDLCFATKLQVSNTMPTPTFTTAPLPTAASTPTALPTGQAAAEATPTVLVEQPPTATPRATPTFSQIDNATPTPEQTRIKLPIDVASIRTASCRGAQVTLLIVVAAALYFVIRNLAVTGVRKVWKPRDVEGFHRRRPREF